MKNKNLMKFNKLNNNDRNIIIISAKAISILKSNEIKFVFTKIVKKKKLFFELEKNLKELFVK
jgi:hypothetical protein